MPSYLYKPDCPHADKSGLVEKNTYYTYLYLKDEDKTAIVGNQQVRINYISDNQPPLRHMALPPGSKPIESKSEFRRITKEQGCIEVGDQTHYLTKARPRQNPDRKQRRDDIKKAIYKLRNGETA